jgi:hypothetical protein
MVPKKIGYGDVSLELRDILPKNKKMPYDKMRPPKLEGKVIVFYIYFDNYFASNLTVFIGGRDLKIIIF